MTSLSRLLFLSTVCSIAFTPLQGFAEDCSGVLPGANCTLDENTTAGLTIDSGITLTIGGSVDIDNTIDGSDTAFGTIITSAGVTVNQNAAIGATNTIDSLSLGAGSTFNVNSSLLTDQSGGDAGGGVQGDIDLDDGGTGATLALGNGAAVRAQIDGEGTGTVTSNGTASVRGQLNGLALNVQSGTFSMEGAVGQNNSLTQFDVQAGARANFSDGSVTVQFLDLDGEISLASDSALSVGNYTADANGGSIELGINRDGGSTSAATVSFNAGGPVDLSGSEFEFVIERGSEVLITQDIAGVIVGDGAATILPTVVDDSFLYDYTLVQNVNGIDVDLSIVRGDVVGSATTGNNAVVAQEVLISLPEDATFTAGAEISDLQRALSNASTQSEYNEILESVLPSVDAGSRVAAHYVSERTMDIASKRILHLRQPARSVSNIEPAAGPGAKRSYNANSKFTEGGRLWSSVFASQGEQSSRDGVDGYDLDSSGIVIGADTGRLNDDWVFGIAGTYGSSEVDSQNANNTQTDVSSYQITGYATYNTANDYFINGAVSWGLHDIETQRNDVGSLGLQADAEYDSEEIGVYGEIGADYKRGNLVVTPSLSAHYSYFDSERYEETGAGGLNLIVNEDTLQSLELSPKITAQWLNQLNNGLRFIPEINAAYSYDILSDDLESSASLQGGTGTDLNLNGFDAQNHKFNIGLAASLVGQTWDMKTLYDYEWNGDLSSHAVALQGIYKF